MTPSGNFAWVQVQQRRKISGRTDRASRFLNLMALLLSALPASAQYTISTVAGGGPPDGTPAVQVGLQPYGVTVDNSGNVYIPSFWDCRVYKVGTSGTVSTVAGNGACGYSGDNGPATNAELDYPQGVAVDSAGNLYIADSGNNRIRRVSGGAITTVAGNGTQGYSGDGGAATGARLSYPNGVALDSAGNLYIADTYNSRIRKVSAGVITTVAGNGTAGYSGDNGLATSAELHYPEDLAVDSSGTLYIADSSNNRIRKVSGGVITTVAGNGIGGSSGDNGQATSAQIYGPNGVAVDSAGNLYIADSGNSRIRKVSDGVITTVVGIIGPTGYSGDNGPATNAQLNTPGGIAVNSAGNLLIADTYNFRIRRVSSGIITTLAGNGSYGYSGDNGPGVSAQLIFPSGTAIDSAGNLYIADSGNNRIRKVSGGKITTVAGNGIAGFSGDNGPATSAQLNGPEGLAVDSAGNLYIADSGNQRIRKVSGAVITTVAGDGTQGYTGGSGPATSTELNNPQGVAVDGAGNLYIADTGNNRIRIVSGGVIATMAGDDTQGYSGDNGPAGGAALNSPYGIAVDSTGNLFIADTVNSRIRKVSGGIITTVAGNGSLGYSGDGGPATSAKLSAPRSVAVDSAGNLFITDSGNLVRKISGGLITTVAATGTYGFSGDNGPAINAKLANAVGVAVDNTTGKVYIADYYNNRVRQLTPATTTITTLSPASAPAGTPGLTLTVNGTNFVNGDIVFWNGAPLATTFAGASQLTAVVPASLLFVTDTAAVSVAVFAGGSSNTATFSITPPTLTCAYTLASGSASVVSTGTVGSNTVGLTATCPYTVASNAPWIGITGGGSGTTSGTISYSVANNTGPARSGTFTVLDGNSLAAAIFTVQQAASPCTSLAVNPSLATFVAGGGNGSGTFNTPGCSWSATVSSNAPWITLPASSGTTSSPLQFSVGNNSTTSSRSGTITVNGSLTIGVTQSGVACSYSISTNQQTAVSTSQNFLSGGDQSGANGISVTAPAGCTWSASANVGWLNFPNGSPGGSGNGTFFYNVDQNSGQGARTGIVTIAGLVYVINEAAGSDTYSAAVSAGAPTLRAEGEAELTGDLVIALSGQTTNAVTGDVVVAYNTTVSNHALSADQSGQTTDALLLVNAPQNPVLGTSAFRGVVAGPNTIRFPNVPLAAAGTIATTLRVTNVRVNASALAVSAAVKATVSLVAPAAPFTFNGTAQQTVGVTQKGGYFVQGLTTGPGPGGYLLVPLTYTEGFASAYRPKLATGQNPSQPGATYNSESGYVNTAALGSETGVAANGTRLVARFANVPANATVFAPLAPNAGNAVLVSADANGAGGYPVSPFAATMIAGVPYRAVTLINGAGTATWEITASNPAAVEALTFNVLLSPGSNLGTVSGGLGPQVAVSAPSLTAPTPRFVPPALPPTVSLSILPQTAGGGTAGSALTLRNVRIHRLAGSQATVVGGTITVTEVLANNGSATATNVVVGGTLPPTATIVGCSADGGNCQFQNNTVGVTYPSLTAGQSKTIVVSANVDGVQPGTYLVYAANVVSDQFNSNFQTGAYTANYPVSLLPVLTLTITHAGNFAQGQQNAAYTIGVQNTGSKPTDGSPVTVTEYLPSGLTLASMTPGGTDWTCSAATASCTNTGVPPLGIGASYSPITVKVNVAPTAPASVDNVVRVAGGGIAGTVTNFDTTSILCSPQAPALVYPSNGQSPVPLTPPLTLTWNTTGGCAAASYDVYFGTASAPPLVGNTAGTSYPAGSLQNSTTYSWKVCAKSSAGTVCSGISQFTTASIVLQAPVLASPSNGGTNVPLTPTLTWAAASGAASYDVYFGTASPPPLVTNTAATSYPAGSLQNSTTYSWKVCAKNSAGTACSDTWQFTTAPVGSITVIPAEVNFGVVGTAVTPGQTVLVSTGAGVAWSAASTAAYLAITPASGAGPGSFQVSLVPGQVPAGTSSTATVVVTAAGLSKQVQVTVTRAFSARTFGSFDSPANNSTGVAGSIAVTGWALDSIGIAKVDIWRERIGSEQTQANGLVYIGDAVFIPGARPDVEGAYPTSPQNYQAGWGYLMLTNFLPNSNGAAGTGNGTYRIHAIAHNAAGQTLDLGTKTIICDNAHAAKPFGAIDTPGQGAAISGAPYVNYGWALAHQPNNIPIDGHTIQVVIDGQVVGSPVYNNYRSDIATLFPGYANSNAAVGYFIIDTTKLTNGLHTIAWVVTDSAGNADGIGSRFFTVLNGSGSSAPAVTKSAVPPLAGGVKLRQGYGQQRPWARLTARKDGTYSVTMPELGRLELQVGAATGYAEANGKRRPLPVGSSLDNGTFRWQLGPGFLGQYDLVFEGRERIKVEVTVRPQSDFSSGTQQ